MKKRGLCINDAQGYLSVIKLVTMRLLCIYGTSNRSTTRWRYGVQIPSRSNLLHVAHDSPPLQPWLCGPWRKAAEMGTAHSWHPKGY